MTFKKSTTLIMNLHLQLPHQVHQKTTYLFDKFFVY